jgi:NAD-dependent dihydropyrimidine dehydrogenase PreA subunit
MTLRYLWISVVQTLLRMLPFPCRTGLIRIGQPDRSSPVLLTGNFQLTVERVKRALAGVNAYLLVANSRGVNVWCAATGGLLTDHDVVSVLKTSGIERLVDHRNVILPQLAATGIEGRVIHRKTGWRVLWGPIEAAAIPTFLREGERTGRTLRTVSFPWPRRVEMAIAWAFPISLLALLVLPVWKEGVLALMGLVWALSFALFLAFPLYEARLRAETVRVGFVFFDFGPRGILLVAWGLFVVGVAAYAMTSHAAVWPPVLRWGLGSLVIALLLSLDLTGSTPVYKSGLHADRLLRITLDPERCKGAAFCEQTCPVDVFVVDRNRRLATLPRAARCVQCGACVVQCPFDALYFTSPGGEMVAPETVRRFKLNLLGKRLVESGTHPDALRDRGHGRTT